MEELTLITPTTLSLLALSKIISAAVLPVIAKCNLFCTIL